MTRLARFLWTALGGAHRHSAIRIPLRFLKLFLLWGWIVAVVCVDSFRYERRYEPAGTVTLTPTGEFYDGPCSARPCYSIESGWFVNTVSWSGPPSVPLSESRYTVLPAGRQPNPLYRTFPYTSFPVSSLSVHWSETTGYSPVWLFGQLISLPFLTVVWYSWPNRGANPATTGVS